MSAAPDELPELVEAAEPPPPPPPSPTEHRETNVACCLFVLVSGVVFDALYALPGAVLADIPASLRTTSICLAVLLGAPTISQSANFVLEQRLLLAFALAGVAVIGSNRAEVTARNADAVFSLIASLSCALACSSNGLQNRESSYKFKTLVREHLAAFCSALLFYLGVRNVRHAFALPSEVQSFTVSHDDISTRGYGIVSDVVVASNAFGGACTASFGVISLLNFDLILHTGSVSLSNLAGALGACVFAAAFVSQLCLYTLFTEVPALFGSDACNGADSDCAAAFRARRLFMASNSPTLSWVSAIALATFAFSKQRRFSSRASHFAHSPSIYSVPYAAVLASSFAALLSVFVFADADRPVELADVELLLLCLSVPVCLLHFPLAACLLHFGGQLAYVLSRVTSDVGYTLTYFTHWSLGASFLLVLAIGLLLAFTTFLYTFREQKMYSEPVEMAISVMSTMLVSTQFFLTLATLGMTSGYTGTYYENGQTTWRVAGSLFTVQHSVSFFFAAALFASRYEHGVLKRWQLRAAWFCLPPVLGAAWLICVAVLTKTHTDPYRAWVDVPSFVIGASAAFVSWVGVGVCIRA